MREQLLASHRALVATAIALVSVDLLLILLHVVHTLAKVGGPAWSIEADGGIGELWQYLKIVVILGVLVLLALRAEALNRPLKLAWLLAFAWLLIDDALQLHENLALAMAGISVPDPEQQYGLLAVIEMLIMLTSGVLILLGLYLSSRRASHEALAWSLALIAGLTLFAGFAIGVDLLHSLIRSRWLHPMLGLIEEAGEMFSLSIIVLMLLRWLAQRAAPAMLLRWVGRLRPAGAFAP